MKRDLSRRDLLVFGGAAAFGASALGAPAHAGPSWPVHRGDPKVIRDLYPRHADLLETGLRTGDPLADAVVAELAAKGDPARKALADGMRFGLAAVPAAPPAVAAYLTAAETVPSWADESALDAGVRTFLSVPVLGHALVLGLHSLVHVYSAPASARVLTGTNSLVYTAERRILETTAWTVQAMLPGGLTPGSAGYVATLQVRLLHAQMRADALRRGWDSGAWGVPVCQVDLARTLLDFTLQPYRSLTRLGFDFTNGEIRAMYTRWRRVGQLLGINPALLAEFTDHDVAAKLLVAIDATNEEPDHRSVELVQATMKAITKIVAWDKLPPESLVDPVNAAMRFLNGDKVADFYGVPRLTVAGPLIPLAIPVVRSNRALLRASPSAWENQQAQTEKDARAFVTALTSPEFETAYATTPS